MSISESNRIVNRSALDAQITMAAVTHKGHFDIVKSLSTYRWVVAEIERRGLPVPNGLAANVPGFGRNFGDFLRKHKRLLKVNPALIESFTIRYVKPERDVLNWAFFDYTYYLHFGRDSHIPSRPSEFENCYWKIVPEDTNKSEADILPSLLEFCRRQITCYGFIAWMTRKTSTLYPAGCGTNGRGSWSDWFYEHKNMSILRDVYPYNFLSRSYLDMAVEGGTLEEWILRDSSRGTLETFTDKIALWKPVVESIPVIREQLFRAGVLIYYFFWQPTSSWYRDFSKPWKCPKEVPEEFRAESYAGDPHITG